MEAPVRQIAQFGDGFLPPFENAYTQNADQGLNALSNLELLISNVIGLVTTLGALIFIIYFLMAALSWITAGGDSSKLEKARGQMLHGVMGLILLVSTYAIIGLIGRIVGIDILNLGQQLSKLIP